jgi:5,5'-dehydrodivanillate O-demethylase
MLTPEQNERLTRVGPGTPCGNLMRRYWIPIAAASQLLENPVKPVRILGEDLVLFKNTKGNLGLIGRRCLHRLVDLQYGIPDDYGLRCPYHGWAYNAQGECVERPLEANPTGKFPRKLEGYPVQEMGGLIFAYMGPLPAPALPRWDHFVWPNAIRQIAINVLNCNWLQCQENTGDPTHSVYTHGHLFKYILEREGNPERMESQTHTLHTRMKWGKGIKDVTANTTKYGFEKFIVFSKELGAERDETRRHSTVVFPFYTSTGNPGGPRSDYQARVPIDDTHTLHITYQCYAAPAGVKAPEQNVIPHYEPPLHDENGKPILDYVLAQDALVWWSQGAIVDRSKESLGRTDVPIMLLRKQLDENITLVEQGKDPLNVFRDGSPDVLFGAGKEPEGWTGNPFTYVPPAKVQDYRRMYHKGFAVDDVDRYGPITNLVAELHRQIEEAYPPKPVAVKDGAVTSV